MSFLLDAIRKAEKQRNEETVPSLEAIVSERRQRSKSRQGGWLIWVALVFVVAATGYLNRNTLSLWWQNAAQYSEQTLTKVKNSFDNIISVEVSDSRSADAGLDDPETRTASNRQEQNEVAGDRGIKVSSNTGGSSQLTDAQRALLSQIEFSVISYSRDPDKRFAMVGSQILREGDQLEGFPIKRIRNDGVVLDINGRSVLIRP